MNRIQKSLFVFPILAGLIACTSLDRSIPTSTVIPETPTLSPIPMSLTETPTATPNACIGQPGHLERGSVQETTPAQDFLIYLPPCYDQNSEERFPVLYLLHGQTYTEDQWVRLGAVEIADKLIIEEGVTPFIIVFPDDRYWNLQAGSSFGQRFVENLIPYIDSNYRSLTDREHRALGGLSRGAGWVLRLGLQHWDLFGTLGLHSPAVFAEDRLFLADQLEKIPPQSWPNIFIDIGENDQELGFSLKFEALLIQMGIPHEWHLYPGAHEELYWGAHVEEYLRWYTGVWMNQEKEP